MRLLGIDPGASGGLVLLESKAGEPPTLVSAVKMPDTLRGIFEAVCDTSADTVLIEQVGAMPTDGRSSLFKFATNYGCLQMAAVAACFPLQFVRPALWQQAIGCKRLKNEAKTKHKARMRHKAQLLFPQIRITNALADAALIAVYGVRLHHGGSL